MKAKYFLLCSILTVCFISCSKDDFYSNDNASFAEAKHYTDIDAQLLPFAKALYGAVKESPALRELIKNKSLEKFNKEYEVLYQFIKDEKVENGLTVRGLLLKHLKNEERLAAIEALHPTLTIHIPILPAGSFSAEIWNTKEQIPAVAIQSCYGFDPVIVSEKGKYVKNSDVFMIENGHVPAFPVLVLKDNERVVVSKNASSKYPSLNNRNSNYVFDFIDDYFDGSVEDKDTEIGLRSVSYRNTPLIDQKLVDAYNLFGTYEGRQRDYIYYNRTPSITTGTLSQNFKESIISFQFSTSHTPQQALGFISNLRPSPPFPWTSGQYNFRAEAQIRANKPDYQQLITINSYFSAYPVELFDVTFVKSGNTYIPTFQGFKSISLNIPILNWDVDYYSELMKISIWKMNPNSTVTQTYTSGSTTTTITYQISDMHLGDAIVTFNEPAIIDIMTTLGETLYGFIDYSTGICNFQIIPVKQY